MEKFEIIYGGKIQIKTIFEFFLDLKHFITKNSIKNKLIQLFTFGCH